MLAPELPVVAVVAAARGSGYRCPRSAKKDRPACPPAQGDPLFRDRPRVDQLWSTTYLRGMRSVTVQEAKTQLSALLRAVEAGEEIEIRRGRTPIAKLVKTEPKLSRSAVRGAWAHLPEPDPSIWEPDPQDAIDFGIVDPGEES